MNWFSLIPAALSALGGLFGSNDTSTTTTTMSPQLKKAASDSLTKATQIWQQPYQKYAGPRVAGPTASRAAVDPVMASMAQQVQSGLNDGNGSQARISQLLNRGPGRVTAPTLVPGGPTASYSQGG